MHRFDAVATAVGRIIQYSHCIWLVTCKCRWCGNDIADTDYSLHSGIKYYSCNTCFSVLFLTYNVGHWFHLIGRICECVVYSLLRAGVQPTLDPSAKTIERSNVLAQERGGALDGVCECVAWRVGWGGLSRREQLVGYLLLWVVCVCAENRLCLG